MPPDRPRQLPLGFGHVPGFDRDDLVVSPANSDAVSLIERWPNWPSSAIILTGPPGAGKSHLGAIWLERSSAGEIDSTLLSGMENAAGTPLFFDDADRVSFDESALFHLLNAAREAGNHVLLTARTPASAWGARLPDLASRLKAATVVAIHEPDDLLLAGVITKLFADRQIQIEANVVSYLVRRMERSLSQANALVDRLDALALERQGRVTRALASELFEQDIDEDVR